jgi:hypothetical protein
MDGKRINQKIKTKIMKKLLLFVTVALLSTACKKEEVTPNTPCNCGAIISDDASNYSVDIKNDCSGNIKTWILSPNDWMSAYVGTNYCITNATSW